MPSENEPLRVENLESATFDCVFPTCGGICCRNGRPAVTLPEAQRIRENLAKFVPHLTERAKAKLAREPFLTKRTKGGLPMLAVQDGWCVFFNEGCVLHKVGAAEGDKFRYKPQPCVTFPLDKKPSGDWYVRQWNLNGEAWDLFCLNPAESPRPAKESLADELRYAQEHGRPES
jgi:hypothetical protein